jgi:hypothetical protein
MQYKAAKRNGLKTYLNTLREYRIWQHSNAPKTSAEFAALPESRLMGCDCLVIFFDGLLSNFHVPYSFFSQSR